VPLFVHDRSCVVVHRLAVPLLCFAFNAFVIYRDSGPVPDLSFLPTIELTWQSLPQVPPFIFQRSPSRDSIKIRFEKRTLHFVTSRRSSSPMRQCDRASSAGRILLLSLGRVSCHHHHRISNGFLSRHANALNLSPQIQYLPKANLLQLYLSERWSIGTPPGVFRVKQSDPRDADGRRSINRDVHKTPFSKTHRIIHRDFVALLIFCFRNIEHSEDGGSNDEQSCVYKVTSGTDPLANPECERDHRVFPEISVFV
jgi:hypothetical protein